MFSGCLVINFKSKACPNTSRSFWERLIAALKMRETERTYNFLVLDPKRVGSPNKLMQETKWYSQFLTIYGKLLRTSEALLLLSYKRREWLGFFICRGLFFIRLGSWPYPVWSGGQTPTSGVARGLGNQHQTPSQHCPTRACDQTYCIVAITSLLLAIVE